MNDFMGQPLRRIGGINNSNSFKMEFVMELNDCCVLK